MLCSVVPENTSLNLDSCSRSIFLLAVGPESPLLGLLKGFPLLDLLKGFPPLYLLKGFPSNFVVDLLRIPGLSPVALCTCPVVPNWMELFLSVLGTDVYPS